MFYVILQLFYSQMNGESIQVTKLTFMIGVCITCFPLIKKTKVFYSESYRNTNLMNLYLFIAKFLLNLFLTL